MQSRRLAENTAALRANRDEKLTEEEKLTNAESCSVLKQASCFFCGGPVHKRVTCPAKQSTCYKCGRKGHYAKMCRSTQRGTFRSATAVADDNLDFQLATLSSASTGDEEKVNMYVLVNGTLANCLLDTGAEHNHIDNKFRQRAKIDVIGESNMKVDLAVKGASVKTQGVCSTSVNLQGREYSNVNFSIMDGLLWDVILGRDFLCKHKSVSFMFDGPQPLLNLGALKPLKGVEPARLFEHLTPNCKPVTSKRRDYSKADRSFISNQVQQLLDDDIIEPSLSPWRAQVVVVKGKHHKKRMCVDYSETINKYTYLDAYPLSNVQNIINEVSQYK